MDNGHPLKEEEEKEEEEQEEEQEQEEQEQEEEERSLGEVYWLADVSSISFVYPSTETGESCSHFPLYDTVLIASGLSTLAVRHVPLVPPVPSPPPITSSSTSACVGRGVPLRLGSPQSSSHLLIPCDTTSAGGSLWRGPPPILLGRGDSWRPRIFHAVTVSCRKALTTR
ncbi:unnamed protein product [Schistocephalus solidus]|uniref:Uncharacterized protein n=1 Tax=Schistocephalus solidus TaxID=70667 RepID=A0A183TFK8_SCHSO|nr:unnamed protein product [Schistocephalus solidus]